MVYVLVADGFEETELIVPVDILKRAGVDVKLVGVHSSEARSTRGITIKTDICLDDLIIYEMDMLVLPGGQPGVDNLWVDERVKMLVKQAALANKFIGAICAAPMILGRLGLLDGKKAVCYPGCEEDMGSAKIVTAPCIRSGKVITGTSAGCAIPFGLELVAALKGREEADRIRNQIVIL